MKINNRRNSLKELLRSTLGVYDITNGCTINKDTAIRRENIMEL